MKKLLRKFFIFFIALVLMWQYLPTLELTLGFENLLLAGVVLTALDTFLKPILKTIMLPVNVVTFGLLSWLAAVVVFWLTTVIIKGLVVVPYTTPQITTDFIIIPQYQIEGVVGYVVTGLVVVILQRFITFVFKKKEKV